MSEDRLQISGQPACQKAVNKRSMSDKTVSVSQNRVKILIVDHSDYHKTASQASYTCQKLKKYLSVRESDLIICIYDKDENIFKRADVNIMSADN